VTEFTEKKKVSQLTLSEKLRMDSHTLLCKKCRSYVKKSSSMDEVLDYIIQSNKNEPIKLDESSKERILSVLKKEK
jgi:hypothetical protein